METYVFHLAKNEKYKYKKWYDGVWKKKFSGDDLDMKKIFLTRMVNRSKLSSGDTSHLEEGLQV